MTRGEVRAETLEHIKNVNHYMLDMVRRLLIAAAIHDTSKLYDPEEAIFREYTPKLKGTTYGSKEYKGYLKEMKVALDHHYADSSNCHHPEHFKDGINDMDLMDLLEMLCDWKAATKRHADGCIKQSLEKNKKRFKISPQLLRVLENTARRLV